MENLTGVVERITFQNEENGFSVIKIKVKNSPDLITVVGNLASVNIGSIIKLTGYWKVDSKFGKQFVVVDYQELVPATTYGIQKYLGSGLIKGIGPVYAKKIVEKFKENSIKIIEETPEKLLEVEGIGPKRVEMIKKGWQEQKEIKNVMLFLQSQGISATYAVKIYKTYGDESLEIVKENPYRLTDDIWGIGFKTADKIARQMGFEQDAYPRCSSGLIYVLNELANEGHCYATLEELLKKGKEILGVEERILEKYIQPMVEENKIILDEGAIYLPPLYHSELGVAKRIKEIISKKSPYGEINVEPIIQRIEKVHRISYDEVQRQGIKMAIKSKFMVLTGGPGTGKTTTTLGVIKGFQSLGAKVQLAAPTGRAAKRMTETTGLESKTIHRLLEYKPQGGYAKNSENPLTCDVLIIDETSMVDIVLMYNLLKGVKDDTVVILVGDVDQLPSVGPGNVLNDIIQSGVVNVVKLTKIFRQAQGSAIITNAHKINKGQFPQLNSGKDSDFFFIEEDEPSKVVEQIKNLCSIRLPKYYKVNPIDDIQVLCPMQRGETGTANLNIVLQDVLNKSSIFIKYGGTTYKLGDKVMQIKNNYDKNVFNGDIGKITAINSEDRTLIITFDDNQVSYDVTELDQVVLAYATTVHKSQGSEYKIVVMPLTTQHYLMLQRNLLYTGVTRAKKIMVIVGTKKAVAMAVKNDKIIKRNTKLIGRLKAQNG
ncbi:exodeoxyribonuclease V alpha subunit [Anaerobranca californiensis DSM 14826]|uniref:ATP-dependent RecD2 DNA helicase n=1 Tax=Anaerobranca californiensis DSM 14826 TaxID=1120989 RepID=A0A1M6LID1_9FIRM|nr:ATP-dependent RecD-like DNA helicase [Anaerobranca californiensis]SHJ70921.1 exodeoxyribonuclease V alpha subunit [Anaerobranca californiensis DSM 14826]